MANVSIKFANRDRFLKQLLSVVPEAEKELADANQKSAAAFMEMAQRLCPTKPTGRLHASIRMYPGRTPGSWVVEAGGPTTTKPVRKGAKAYYDYALGVEFGHKSRPAGETGEVGQVSKEPFFWPAYRAQKRPMKGRASRALTKAIKAKGFGTNG